MHRSTRSDGELVELPLRPRQTGWYGDRLDHVERIRIDPSQGSFIVTQFTKVGVDHLGWRFYLSKSQKSMTHLQTAH